MIDVNMIKRWKLAQFAFLFLVALSIATGITFVVPAIAQEKPVRKKPKIPTTGKPPEGYQQLLPRGGIPAIKNPTYVSADEAEIDDESMVLGVVIEETPIAYSLNLLNSHEIVNDSVGKTNFAAVW